MKKYLVHVFLLISFAAGCVAAPALPASTPLDSTATIPSLPTFTPIPPTPTTIPIPSTPTVVPLPDGLSVAYAVNDELWLWKENHLQLLTRHPSISAPVFSDDGQWILFRERNSRFEAGPLLDELWITRPDGSELQLLMGSDDLLKITGGETSLIDDIGWVPGRQEILFNTDEIIEGPPESWPAFDLYSLDLSGHVTRLAKPGQGGRFFPSPDGFHVALVTNARISVLDLESHQQRTLLEFTPVEKGCECLYLPEVVWDPAGQFVLTSILPQKFYYPEAYKGEPMQVWRLWVDGQAELITEIKPFGPAPGIAVSPNTQYFAYLKDFCPDGMGKLYLHILASGEETSLTCAWYLPHWLPDSERFTYKSEWLWQLGSISGNIGQPVDIMNVPIDPNVVGSPQLTWMDNEYSLLLLHSPGECTLNVATLQGFVAEIARTKDVCPSRFDFDLPH